MGSWRSEAELSACKGGVGIPSAGFENVYQIMCAVLQGVRPTIHSSVPNPIKALMRSCWQAQPRQRPHFREIVDSLETAWQHYQARSKPPKPRPPRPKEERLHTSPPRIARAAKKKASSEPRRHQKQDEVADAPFLPLLPQAKRHNRRKVKDKTGLPVWQ